MILTCVGCITQVQASFFGVGAPEAVLVGLVALVIFGPQGLAEVIMHTSSCVVCVAQAADNRLGSAHKQYGLTRLSGGSCHRQPRQLARQ